MFRCVILAGLLAFSHSWLLLSSHKNIIPKVTNKVTLHCFNNNPHIATPIINRPTRIQLLKMDSSHSWKAFARMVLPETSEVVLTEPGIKGISASGHLGLLNETFLSLTWSDSFHTVLGHYKCLVDGFSRNGVDARHVATNEIDINNNVISQKELIDVVIGLKNELKLIKEKNEVQVQELKNNMSKLKTGFEDNNFELQHWPSGNFSLLLPDSGCPDAPYSKFIESKYIIEANTTQKPSHKRAPHQYHNAFIRQGTTNIYTFRYCRRSVKEPALRWPKGSYCINWTGKNSPAGFLGGGIRLFLENGNNESLKIATENTHWTVGFNNDKKFIDMYFGCRNDGNVDTPIVLPNSKPFYLYRYKGKCQAVFNMDVNEEALYIDTDDKLEDKTLFKGPPDTALNDVNITLCYYTRRNTNV